MSTELFLCKWRSEEDFWNGYIRSNSQAVGEDTNKFLSIQIARSFGMNLWLQLYFDGFSRVLHDEVSKN
jgi:hypothetical protein